MISEKNSKSLTESEEASLETTIPTDFTLSPESDEGKQSKLTLKQQLEKKQLLHDLQLLKIELSHKTLIIDNMKAEHMAKVDDFEDKVADLQHQKHVIQARLEAQLKIHQDDAKRRISQTRQEMEMILKKQEDLEETNLRLQERAGDIRRSLRELELNEEQYYDLKEISPDLLSLKDFVAMRIYEIAWPLKVENVEMRQRENRLKENLKTIHQECLTAKDELDINLQLNAELTKKVERLNSELSELKEDNRNVDYKRDNFDKIKRERDQFEIESQSLKKITLTQQNTIDSVTKEKEELFSEVKSLRQKLPLLIQDKDYFSKQVIELNSKLSHTEERLHTASIQLERAQAAREEIYEKFLSSRDKFKGEYEQRLNDDLNKIQENTAKELEKIKLSQQQIYELEIKSMKDARDNAIKEREISEEKFRDVQTKYDHLRMEVRDLHSSESAQLSDLRSEVKVKTLELERARMTEGELTKNFKELQIEVEKLYKKNEIVTSELYELQNKYHIRVAELETSLSEKITRLQNYDKLEQDLDDIVIKAAEIGDDKESERVLFSFGYGANVPTTAKRRLQQSVQLARRVLALEKINTDISRQLETEKEKLQKKTEECNNAKKLLNQAEQPYGYMIDGIRARDEQIQKYKERISSFERELDVLKQEKKKLIKIQNQMSQDLERLLNQREEFNVMKKHLAQLQRRSRSSTNLSVSSQDEDTDSSFKFTDSMEHEFPPATIFTKPKRAHNYAAR